MARISGRQLTLFMTNPICSRAERIVESGTTKFFYRPPGKRHKSCTVSKGDYPLWRGPGSGTQPLRKAPAAGGMHYPKAEGLCFRSAYGAYP